LEIRWYSQWRKSEYGYTKCYDPWWWVRSLRD
jgi:hypothetical protein